MQTILAVYMCLNKEYTLLCGLLLYFRIRKRGGETETISESSCEAQRQKHLRRFSQAVNDVTENKAEDQPSKDAYQISGIESQQPVR